jgi:hypothetical protein
MSSEHLSVHDNWIYAQSIDHDRRRIILHTIYPSARPIEYTDIIFEAVVVHHFEQQMVGGGEHPANLLFGVEETDPSIIISQYADLFTRTKNYGWPMLTYNNFDDLAARLTAGGAKCFEVHGVVGLSGFVFAISVEFRARKTRAEVASDA